MPMLLVARKVKSVASIACYKLQEKTSERSIKSVLQVTRRSVASRASYKLQEEVKSVASRVSSKLQEEVDSVWQGTVQEKSG